MVSPRCFSPIKSKVLKTEVSADEAEGENVESFNLVIRKGTKLKPIVNIVKNKDLNCVKNETRIWKQPRLNSP